jgi:hypothetical protein
VLVHTAQVKKQVRLLQWQRLINWDEQEERHSRFSFAY